MEEIGGCDWISISNIEHMPTNQERGYTRPPWRVTPASTASVGELEHTERTPNSYMYIDVKLAGAPVSRDGVHTARNDLNASPARTTRPGPVYMYQGVPPGVALAPYVVVGCRRVPPCVARQETRLGGRWIAPSGPVPPEGSNILYISVATHKPTPRAQPSPTRLDARFAPSSSLPLSTRSSRRSWARWTLLSVHLDGGWQWFSGFSSSDVFCSGCFVGSPRVCLGRRARVGADGSSVAGLGWRVHEGGLVAITASGSGSPESTTRLRFWPAAGTAEGVAALIDFTFNHWKIRLPSNGSHHPLRARGEDHLLAVNAPPTSNQPVTQVDCDCRPLAACPSSSCVHYSVFCRKGCGGTVNTIGSYLALDRLPRTQQRVALIFDKYKAK
ncbi:hypothetical protein BD779DRAFT_1473514 [Infundibulicybe gibba]|nr:hypothetical protein BD779DRAFT_1473514 [Infundibulicybe gibba]